jgi:transcriptional regulator with XRE-family HTH domain
MPPTDPNPDTAFYQKIRGLRASRGLSLKKTAELSGLNINTLSLIENGRISPSVSTLQQLAAALGVPISAFFESEPVSHHVVFTSHLRRPGSSFGQTRMENLAKDLCGNAVQPFVVTLEPGAGSGDQFIVHTGHEFVYCLAGRIRYTVEDTDYLLEPEDSLVFEAHLPHKWMNVTESPARLILVLYPADQHEEPGSRHFPN